MKLHLPFGLRKALLACLAALAAALPSTLSSASLGFGALAALALSSHQSWAAGTLSTQTTTTEDGKTYAGKIVDVSLSATGDMSTSTVGFSVDGSSVTGDELKYIGTDGNLGTLSTGSEAFWKNTFTDVGNASSTYGHTLRFGHSSASDSATYGDQSLLLTFAPLVLGGLITEAHDSVTYTITTDSTGDRTIKLKSGSAGTEVLFSIGSNMTFVDSGSYNHQAHVQSDATFEIAGGKTLSWQHYGLTVEEGQTLKVQGLGQVSSGTKGTLQVQNQAITLYSGSTLELHLDQVSLDVDQVTASASSTIHWYGVDTSWYDEFNDDPFHRKSISSLNQGIDLFLAEPGATFVFDGLNNLPQGYRFACDGEGYFQLVPEGDKAVAFQPKDSTNSTDWGMTSSHGTPNFTLGGSNAVYDFTSSSSSVWQTDNDITAFLAKNASGNATLSFTGGEVTHLRLWLRSTCTTTGPTIAALPNTVTALWLNSEERDVGTSVGKFEFHTAVLPGGLTDLYVNDAGFKCQVDSSANNLSNLTLHLGGSQYNTNVDGTAGLKKANAFFGNANLTIKALDVQDPSLVLIAGGRQLTVGTLGGTSDLRLAGGSGGNTTKANLGITSTSELKGHIDFVAQAADVGRVHVVLNSGVTLSIEGVLTGSYEDGANRHNPAFFDRSGNSGSATVKITGLNAPAVQNVTFSSGVSLEIASGASQMFGDGCSIATLTGAGALGVTGTAATDPTLTVTNISGFTGAVHLVGNGENAGNTVLALGSSTVATNSSTLSSVVLREGGGSIKLGKGNWTLGALSVKGDPSSSDAAPSSSELRLSAQTGATGASLQFGSASTSAVKLGANVNLHLGAGLTYGGWLSVELASQTSGGKIQLAASGVSLATGGLTLDITGSWLSSWINDSSKKYTLFDASSLTALGGLLGNIHVTNTGGQLAGHNLSVQLNAQGELYLQHEQAIYWTGTDNGNSPKWSEGNTSTLWSNGNGQGEPSANFIEHDSVIFLALPRQGGPAVATQSVTVSGAVHAQDMTVGATDGLVDGSATTHNGANYTFAADPDAPADSIELAGNLTLAGTWLDDSTTANSQATFNLPVSFTTGAHAITGGEVHFASTVTGVTGTTLSIGAGGGGTPSSIVTFSAAGNNNLGTIEIGKGSTLVIAGAAAGTVGQNNFNTANTTWGTGSKVNGEGTVRFDIATKGGSGSVTNGVIAMGGDDNNFLTLLLNGQNGTNHIGTVEAAPGTFLALTTGSGIALYPLWRTWDLRICDGAGIALGAQYQLRNAPSQYDITTKRRTLYLSGNGDGSTSFEGALTNNRTTGWNAALVGATNADNSIAWDVALEGNTSIGVSVEGRTLTIGDTLYQANGGGGNVATSQHGTFDANGHELTKVGKGNLTLSHVVTGERHAAGKIILASNSGRVTISGIEDGSSSRLVATEVDVNQSSTTFAVSGNGSTYEVTTLKLGETSAHGSGNTIVPETHVDVGSGATLSVTTLDLTTGNSQIQGGGTLKVTGSVTGRYSLNLTGGGTTLELAMTSTGEPPATTPSMSGGLYMKGGKVKLSVAEFSVGYLSGGTSNEFSGSIITEREGGATLTITGSTTSHAVKDLSVGSGVTVKLAGGAAPDSAGASQGFTGLSGEGSLALGDRATATLKGTSNSIGSISGMGQGSVLQIGSGGAGSLTVNGNVTGVGGHIRVYDGGNACTLTVNGDVTLASGGTIHLGMDRNNRNQGSAVTITGNLTIENTQHSDTATAGDSASMPVDIWNGMFTVRGKILGNSTASQMRLVSGKLVVGGSNAAGDNILTNFEWDGPGTVQLGLNDATNPVTFAVQKFIFGTTETVNITGNGTMKVQPGLGVTTVGDASHGKITLGGKATLEKSGEGTLQLCELTATAEGTHVLVSGGTLKFVGEGAVSLHDVKVDGSSSVLEFNRGGTTVTVGGEGDQVTLANGGVLKSGYSGAAETTYAFGALNIEGGTGGNADAGDITFSASATKGQTFTFSALTGSGDITISAMGGAAGAQRVINLGKIDGYSGAFTATTDDNNVLTIGGEIVSGAQTGSIVIAGGGAEGNPPAGAVTVNGSATVRKTGGAGEFAISHLKLTSGQGLQMDYAGAGALSITKLTLAAGTHLSYTEAVLDTDTKVVEFDWGTLKANFTMDEAGGSTFGGKVGLRLEGFDPSTVALDALYLGIYTTDTNLKNTWTQDEFDMFFDNGYGDEVELSWVKNGERWDLYLRLSSYEQALRYWDENWGTEAANGPSNKQLGLSAAVWYRTEGGEADPDCLWYKLLGPGDDGASEDTPGGSFTTKCLSLLDEFTKEGGSDMVYNNTVYVRLEKGSSLPDINEKGTKLTILGGKLYNDASAGSTDGMQEYDVYISLWAHQDERFHLLAGGSSFVQTASGGSLTLGFRGDTHIQVQGGTVDHIVGGNHVTNSPAIFEGDTYISVYEGAQGKDENGDPDGMLQPEFGTDVCGGIVGGSTVTASGASGEVGTYDFDGHSHIYIYTVLKGRRDQTTHKATTISDGNDGASDDPELYHIVGGNAWIGSSNSSGAGGTKRNMAFRGASEITIDLSGYENFYASQSDRGGESFEKAIVGGNFSGEAAPEGGANTETSFVYNPGASGSGYASAITIYGVYWWEAVKENRNVEFWGGINGASRRDNAGGSITNYDAGGSEGILIDLHGGAYRNMVAGGFWFGGTRSEDIGGDTDTTAAGTYSGALTLDANGSVTVNLDQGEYWRVVGGNYSNGGAYSTPVAAGDGNNPATGGGILDGNTVVTVTGAATFDLGYDLTTRKQGPNVTQSNVAALVGGSFLEGTTGSHTQTGTATLNVEGGVFKNAHIVAGDYVLYGTGATGAKKYDVSIRGGTELTLGSDLGSVTINGLVVGGSYVYDKTQGGSSSIGVHSAEEGGETQAMTHVVVNGGVTLNAETDRKGNALHDGIALVGGSVLIDESTGSLTIGGESATEPSHTLNIHGGTEIEVKGGEINGLVVGGSYSALSPNATPNELNIEGNSSIAITGGTVNGNIIGGHFSANTENPDILRLGNVNVTLDGGAVNGYIFGGSMRRCVKGLGSGDSPTQEEITVSLKSGTLAGGVYAAGNHYQTGEDAKLNVRTKSTRVEVYGGFDLQQMQYGSALVDVGISGGYQRNIAEFSQGSGNANDYSTVGYTPGTGAEPGTWSEQAATLAFMAGESGGDFSSLTQLGAHLHLQDFDAVDVAAGMDVDMHGSVLLVMHKLSSAKDVGGHDTFTKTGAGNLTLAALKSWHAQEGPSGLRADYTGKIILHQGNLTLAGNPDLTAGGLDYTQQSLEGGLKICMDGRSFGNKDDAYLKGGENMKFTRGALSSGGKIGLELYFENDDKLQQGVYYLVDGLDMDQFVLGGDTAIGNYFDLNDIPLADAGGVTLKSQLVVRDGDKLALRVYVDAPDVWYWDGSNTETGSVWTQKGQDSDELTENWTKQEVTDEEKSTFNQQTYYFTAGAENQDVVVDDGVVAGSIEVQSGDFNFTQGKEGGGSGLELQGDMVVGSDNPMGEAHARLGLKNEAIPGVQLKNEGTLELGVQGAIQDGTKLKFQGGTLMYGEDGQGKLALRDDLSGQVSEEEKDNTAGVKIQVGGSPSETAPATDDLNVEWSNRDNTDNSGVKLILEKGLTTSGRGHFQLDLHLTNGTTSLKGEMTALEGKQTLSVSGGTAALTQTTTAATGATVELVAASGAGITAEGKATFDGTGVIQVGDAGTGATGAYKLGADNKDFGGALRLVGDSSSSEVTYTAVNALGGEGTALELSGRAIVSGETADQASAITAKSITITEGTTTYVGGYDALTDPASADAKTAYTLKAEEIHGTGTLANAAGGFAGALTGDITDFSGTIVAGAAPPVGKVRAVALDEPEGARSTWRLEGDLYNGNTVAANLAGTGVVTLGYTVKNWSHAAGESPVLRLTGVVSGAVDVVHDMEGTVLALAGGVVGSGENATPKNSSTGSLIFNGNEIWLGDGEGTAGSWSGGAEAGTDGEGNLLEGSLFVLRRGVLARAFDAGGVELRVNTDAVAAADDIAWVNARGTDGSKFSEITVNANGRLRGVSGDVTVGSGERETRLSLTLTAENIGTAPGAAQDYLLGVGGNLTVQNVRDEQGQFAFNLDLSSEGLLDILKRHRADNVLSYLHLVTGGTISFTDEGKELDKLLRSGNYTELLSQLGFTMGVQGGDLTLAGSSKNVYIVLNPATDKLGQGDAATLTDPEDINEKGAVLVDSGATLTLDDEDDGAGDAKEFTLNNLVGLEGSSLNAGDPHGNDKLKVTLNNSDVLPAEEEKQNDEWLDDKTGDPDIYNKLEGLDTSFEGTIRGFGEGVNFLKTGKGRLTVGSQKGSGGLAVRDGTLTLSEGAVTLRGSRQSELGTLAFDYEEENPDEKRGLTVDGARLTVKNIETGESDADPSSNKVELEKGGELVYAGEEGEVESMHFSGADGTGTLGVSGSLTLNGSGDWKSDVNGANVRVETGGKLSLAEDAEMDAGEVTLEAEGNSDGVLDLSGSEVEQKVGSLAGGGTLQGAQDSKLTVTGSAKPKDGAASFSGTLAGGGTLTVAEEGELTLDGIATNNVPGSDQRWNVTNRGKLTLDTSASESKASFGDVLLAAGSETTLRVNTDDDMSKSAPNFHTFNAEADANLTLESTGQAPLTSAQELVIGRVEDKEDSGVKDANVQLKGLAFLRSEVDKDNTRIDENGDIIIGTRTVDYNRFAKAVPNMGKNPNAGATMFWDASAPTPGDILYKALTNPDSDFYRMLSGLTTMLENGETAGLAQALAAGAGSSIATLGPALSEDMHRQLNSIRNRTTTVGSEEVYDGYNDLPIWQTWVHAETGYHKLDADGFAPGFTLNNWGGTLGETVDISPATTLGLALSAMYGDLKADAADTASGDMDTVYLSGFARTMHGAWTHTFVISGGLADINMNRTVNYGAGSYRTNSATNGYALGALYELGYTRLMNKSGSVALQPVVNIEARHAHVDGFSESGSDCGLKTDDIDQTVVTLGLGARAQAAVGQNAFNRASIFEARALVKFDFGDRSGAAMNKIIGAATAAEVESAEVGAVGIELGAGITVPLGSQGGSVFLDASLECRHGWTTANATLGYKVTF